MSSEKRPPLLIVHTLGRLDIRGEGLTTESIALRKAQALLVYLLLNPGPHDRGRLAGLLWGEFDEKRARHNLRQTLWHLRRGLAPGLLVEDRLTVGLAPEVRVQVDALVFEREIQAANRCCREREETDVVEHLRRAVDIYQGEFLSELEMEESPEFANWRAGYAAHLREMALTALSRLTAALLRRGEYEQALIYARRQLQMEPWWEEGHRLVMTLLALNGQRGAALAQYETCRRLLAEEVGVEPMPETTALYRRLLHWQGEDWRAPADAAQTVQAPFCGRGEEHARLVAWWEDAQQGRARLALIAGEAGVGKTRLVEEVIHYAEMQAARILRGRCYEFGGDIPYQPIAEAVRAFLAQTPNALPARLSPTWLSELARLTPELRDRFPDLPEPRRVAGVAARQRLFEAVARFLQALNRPATAGPPTPVLFFLDDLHWADASTLDLLHYLLRQLRGAAIWLVGTYRPEETGPGHLLTRLRQGLSRDHLVDHLMLHPLSAAAVGEIAHALLGDEVGESLADLLYRESEGNPFILMETVYSLQEQLAAGRKRDEQSWREALASTITPRSVQDVILQRVERLSPPARRMLTLAAVIGRRFDDALLRAATRQNARTVNESLDEWLARHLVRPEPASPGHYDFSHDKIRAVVYQTAEPGRRRALHGQVAQALEQSDGVEEQAGQLAYHWSQAGDMARAAPYLLKAGDQARLLYAEREAVAYYRQALAYLQKTGADEQAARTLMKLGLTYHNAFDFARAREAYDRAFALWQRAETRPDRPPPPPAARALRIRWLEPLTLDPALVPDSHTDCLVGHLFSGLVELSPGMNITPDVARAWEVTEEGRTFIFHLREDARWSDGAAVTAHDFEYTWKRVLNPVTGSRTAFILYDLKGGRAFHRGEGSEEDVGVRALDDHTLLVELERPVGYFLQLLTHIAWHPVPRHMVEKEGAAWAEREGLVCNGAFRLEAWKRGEFLTLARNPAYHGRFQGNVQRVTLLLIQDWATRLQLYEADELDILGITYLSPLRREALRQRHADEYIARPRLETHFLVFDVTRPPFDDVRVRRALVLSADRVTLADRVLQGYVTPATGGLTPPGMPGHAADIALPYDPEAARRLLAQAGFPNGRGFPRIEMLVFEAVKERNEHLQKQWRDVLGVEMRLDVVEWPEFVARLGRATAHMVNLAWLADYPDPDNFLRVSRSRGWPMWRSEVYERLIEEARGLTESARRLQCYRQAEEILVQEAPILPLVYERDHLLIKPRLRRYPMSAIRPAFWKDVVME